jgi:putative effector of murein hydrolase LrgA (UPF0299 family)
MLPTCGFLLGCQLIGEIAVRALGLPVLGLALLLLALRVWPKLAERGGRGISDQLPMILKT